MRSIFGHSIIKTKDLKGLIKVVEETQYRQREIFDMLRDIVNTGSINSEFANNNFKKHYEHINTLITRVNDIEKKLFIIVKNN